MKFREDKNIHIERIHTDRGNLEENNLREKYSSLAIPFNIGLTPVSSIRNLVTTVLSESGITSNRLHVFHKLTTDDQHRSSVCMSFSWQRRH